MDSSSPSAAESAAEVSAALAPRAMELSADIYQLIVREIPQLRSDQRVLELLEASVGENVATVVHILQHGIDLENVHAPAAAEEYARRLAQRGVPIAALLRAYRIGSARFEDWLLQELGRRTDNAAVVSAAGLRIATVLASYIDKVSEEVVSAYESEKETWLRNQSVARAARVRALLRNEQVDVESSEAILGYRLSQRHLGVVTWMSGAATDADSIGRLERATASPGAILALLRANYEIDVRHVLPSIRVPTLILHRVGDKTIPVACGRYIAERIPGAKYIEHPGDDHLLQAYDRDLLDRMIDEIEEFITGTHHRPEPDRVLATVMFTDIARSTERAAELGDERWRELLKKYYEVVRKELVAFRGREVDSAGDGLLATFDGPARAIRCAREIAEATHNLGVEVRLGLHTGECDVRGDDLGGLAVHIAARVAAAADADEVLVSSTVKDLVAGSGITFEDRGEHDLKGVPDTWRIYAVT